MSLKLCVRYNIDLTVTDQTRSNGKKKNDKKPIGATIEYVGDVEDIKRRINTDIDRIFANLEDMYYGDE